MRQTARCSAPGVVVLRLATFASLPIIVACSSDRVVGPNENGPGAAAAHAGFVVSTPLAEGVDTAALTLLVADAKAQHSDALVVVRNGKLVYEDYFGTKEEPLAAMSMSKSMVSLAFGFLLADGKLASLDEPVTKLLPSFAAVDARKATMTYRHLLSMTSGIDPTRAIGTTNDMEATANASRVFFTPGTSWQYSNNGVEVLSVLAGKLAGKPLDVYLNEKLFAPLGITSVSWAVRDKRGVPYGDGEMLIRPLDLAKIGQTILNGGTWAGKPVIRSDWIDQSLVQSSAFTPLYGLLWWRSANNPLTIGVTDDLLAQWTGNGLPTAIATKLKPLVGTTFGLYASYTSAIANLLTADETAMLTQLEQTGDHIDYFRYIQAAPGHSRYAEGWLGQYLDIVADRQLVVVRMRRAHPADYANPKVETDAFTGILADVVRLVP